MSNLGNKEIMARNIQHYMNRYDKTRKDMCEALGVKYTTFTDWVTGESYPRIDKVEMMANYFGISKSDLVEDKSKASKRGVAIPVLGRVAAGVPIEAIEDIVDTEEISEEMARTGDFFGLRIQGDSMEPRMESGDVVIVRQQSDADSGDTVIAIVNGEDATCKKLRKFHDGIELVATNPNHAPVFFSNEEIEALPVKIIGRVMELRQKY